MRRITLLAALPALALVGCGGGDGDGGSSSSAAADSAEAGGAAEVVMKLVAFKPGTLEVEAGTTVTWNNTDIGAHTVTSGTVEQGGAGVTQQPDGTFESGQLAKGETFEQTFDEPGTYPYFCALHPATMRGEIRVA